jgi:hypothetical protein
VDGSYRIEGAALDQRLCLLHGCGGRCASARSFRHHILPRHENAA